MFKNIKSFNAYSLIAAILIYISAGFVILTGLIYLVLGLLGSLGLIGASSSGGIPILAVLFFVLIFIFIASIYIVFGVTLVFAANHYIKRSNETKKLIDSDDQQEQLIILKEVERHEFWIERLMQYPVNYISGIFMICTIVFAPVGILMIMMTNTQRKMDLLKDKYNYGTDTLSVESKIENSNEIFKFINKKVQLQVWVAIAGLICSILFLSVSFTLLSQIKPTSYYQNTLPGEYKNVPSEFKNKEVF
jgi:hypothetical protein